MSSINTVTTEPNYCSTTMTATTGSGWFTGLEMVAGALGALMMLGPLAAAAIGAHF